KCRGAGRRQRCARTARQRLPATTSLDTRTGKSGADGQRRPRLATRSNAAPGRTRYRTSSPVSDRRNPEEENAMTTAALSPIHPTTPRQDPTAHTTRRQQAGRTIRLRMRRIPGFLLVVAILLPLLITALFGN